MSENNAHQTYENKQSAFDFTKEQEPDTPSPNISEPINEQQSAMKEEIFAGFDPSQSPPHSDRYAFNTMFYYAREHGGAPPIVYLRREQERDLPMEGLTHTQSEITQKVEETPKVAQEIEKEIEPPMTAQASTPVPPPNEHAQEFEEEIEHSMTAHTATPLSPSEHSMTKERDYIQIEGKDSTSGTIKLDNDLNYIFTHFNAEHNYSEVKMNIAEKYLNPFNWNKEAVFKHKENGSEITIKKNKIIGEITNTSDMLDIAQDKGWTSVKIKGGSKEAQAKLWLEANLRGFETRGYRPSAADKKLLHGELARRQKQQDSLEFVPKEQPSQGDNNAAVQELISEATKMAPINTAEYNHMERAATDIYGQLMTDKSRKSTKASTNTIARMKNQLTISVDQEVKAKSKNKSMENNKQRNLQRTKTKDGLSK